MTHRTGRFTTVESVQLPERMDVKVTPPTPASAGLAPGEMAQPALPRPPTKFLLGIVVCPSHSVTMMEPPSRTVSGGSFSEVRPSWS